MDDLAPVNILLVEDDPGDQKLVKISLKSQMIANDLHIVGDGEQALEYLDYCKTPVNGVELPHLILLDLNMPGMNGKEFLKRIKEDSALRGIPVVILTTSDSEKDILESYNLQASGYVRKPVDITEFKEVMRRIGEYWFVICRRPVRDN
ncbi:MAG: response regulator [Chloroflexota bacterium]|nr:response regulator [Chloroflexota bacterium]